MERLVTFFVVEPGADGSPSLFKVRMLLSDIATAGLVLDEPDAWRHVIAKTRGLIADHLSEAS